MIMLIKKDPDKGDVMCHLRPITLLNSELEILINELMKSLAWVMGTPVADYTR